MSQSNRTIVAAYGGLKSLFFGLLLMYWKQTVRNNHATLRPVDGESLTYVLTLTAFHSVVVQAMSKILCSRRTPQGRLGVAGGCKE